MAEEVGDAFDKLKAGVKAVATKVTYPDRDLGTEYEKEIGKFNPLKVKQIWKDAKI